MSELCIFQGCTMMGVFPGERTTQDGETLTGMLCFGHSEGDEVVAIEPEQIGGFHIDVVNGLAAMLLEHTAMSMVGTEDATGDAMRSLAANTEWTEDVAAGVLLALSYIAAAGQVGDDELLHGSEVFERLAAQEADEDAPLTPETDPSDDYRPAGWTSDQTPPDAFPHPPEDEHGTFIACAACDDGEHEQCEDPREKRGPSAMSPDDTWQVIACCCGALDMADEITANDLPGDPAGEATEQTEESNDGQHESAGTAGG